MLHYSNACDDPGAGAAPGRATPTEGPDAANAPLPLLRRPTVAGSLDADEDDAVHFASAAICRLRVMPRAARACDTARRNQR